MATCPSNAVNLNECGGSGGATLPIVLTTDVSGVLPEANGGTGESTFAKGDLLAGNATTTLGKQTAGADGTVLTADSTKSLGVDWKVPSSGITGSLTATRVPFATGAAALADSTKFKYIATGNEQLIIPDGSQGQPGQIFSNGSQNIGTYTVAGLHVIVAGGGNALITGGSSVEPGFDLLPHSSNALDLGGVFQRWRTSRIRHHTYNVRTITVDTTLDSTYQSTLLNSTVTPRTATLPSAVTSLGADGNSLSFTLRNNGVQAWTIASVAGNVNGAATDALAAGAAATFRSDGTDWWRFS